MDAQHLFKAGKLTEAISALNITLRENPADQRSRTFLFELLCFAGEFDRAERELSLLMQKSRQESVLGTLLYRSVLNAEKTRQEMFETRNFPSFGAVATNHHAPVAGRLNGKEFSHISDADPRIEEKLEIFSAGDYLWLSYADISTIHVSAPKRLRDLLWIPAHIKTGSAFHSLELGEVMIPSMAPLSWQHPDEEVRLGRVSEWCEDESGDVAPYGLKTILVDNEELPVVEIRHLEIYPVTTNVHHA